MRVRETEAAILMCELFEFPAGAKFQFLDLNVDVKRLLEHCWDHEKGYPKMKQSPWHSKPPTLVGSMKLFLRYRDSNAPNGFRARIAEGFEYFRLQGWDDSMFQKNSFPTQWSFWSCVPTCVAMLGACGTMAI